MLVCSSADSAHDLEPVLQELQVAAKVGGGDELLGPLGRLTRLR
jgi:hypothetical protein